jgi:hypothetical protein
MRTRRLDMKIALVDERDINIELPLPTFRVAVWETSSSVGSFDIVDATVSEVLEYAKAQAANAATVEVFALMTTTAGQRVRILLETFGAPLENTASERGPEDEVRATSTLLTSRGVAAAVPKP